MPRSPSLSSSSASDDPFVSWARQEVFPLARALAWEGAVTPATPSALFPADHPLLQRLGPVVGLPWARVVFKLDRPRVASFLAGLTHATLPASLDYRLTDRLGSIFWIRHTVLHLSGRGHSRRARSFIQDVQAEKDYQLESLRVSEREQNRIGQDLHDDLCQVLAGVSCLLRVTEAKLAKTTPSEVESLREINQQVIEAMQRTRALTHGLFPGKVQIADIRGALLELAQQMRTRFGLEVKTQFSGRFPRHSSAQVIQIFRIAQEAASNAVKHGSASEIRLRLAAEENTMRLTVEDNGRGFSKGHHNQAAGIGLAIMNFRAGLLGGDLRVTNIRPQGVSVCLSYPFDS